MLKKISIVTLCCSVALLAAVVLPKLGTSEEFIDDNATCMNCHVNDVAVHDIAVLHNIDHFIENKCDDCHINGEPVAGNVRATSCLACHPADQAGPGVNAGKCDLIDFHLENADYQASGESCIASDCHLDQCNAASTSTSSVPASSTTSSVDEDCPSVELYGNASAEVALMRSIRDDVLRQTPEGREIIKLYYQWAPFIAAAVRNDKALRSEIKEILDGILGLTVK